MGRHIEVIEQVQFLVNEGDAAADRFRDREIMLLLATKLDDAGAWRRDATQDSHQCAFTRTVFPNQPNDLAGRHGKVDIGQSLYPRIGFEDADQFEDGFWHASSLICGGGSRVLMFADISIFAADVSDSGIFPMRPPAHALVVASSGWLATTC